MTPRTILHTIETSGPGGAETSLLLLASKLNRDRFRSVALLPREGWLSQQLRAAGVPVYFADSKKWYDLRLVKEMRRVIGCERVDLIHSQLPGQNFYSCLVGSLSARKTVATYQGALELKQSKGWKDGVRQAVVSRLADAVVAVSEDVRTLLRRAHFPAERVVRIYNAIDMEKMRVRGNGHLRHSLSLPEGSLLVGTVANIRAPKGYAFLIRAARMVIDRIPQAHFVAVGDIDPVLSRPLFEQVETLGLKNQFHFLGFRGDVPRILSELDVFVLASTSEGLPLALLEAMAAGKPAVATRCGGPEEVIEDGVTGLLVAPGDPAAIASAVTELLGNPEWATRLAKAGRAKVEAEFTIEKTVGQYEGLYERLLNGV
ncbi:MAG TPA: glycosyltransferase [Candidatus Dormibacteraeota bacterium]|nr:glycosyltransferase [Candidatus Dormibacteraeota bacterium]